MIDIYRNMSVCFRAFLVYWGALTWAPDAWWYKVGGWGLAEDCEDMAYRSGCILYRDVCQRRLPSWFALWCSLMMCWLSDARRMSCTHVRLFMSSKCAACTHVHLCMSRTRAACANVHLCMSSTRAPMTFWSSLALAKFSVEFGFSHFSMATAGDDKLSWTAPPRGTRTRGPRRERERERERENPKSENDVLMLHHFSVAQAYVELLLSMSWLMELSVWLAWFQIRSKRVFLRFGFSRPLLTLDSDAPTSCPEAVAAASPSAAARHDLMRRCSKQALRVLCDFGFAEACGDSGSCATAEHHFYLWFLCFAESSACFWNLGTPASKRKWARDRGMLLWNGVGQRKCQNLRAWRIWRQTRFIRTGAQLV